MCRSYSRSYTGDRSLPNFSALRAKCASAIRADVDPRYCEGRRGASIASVQIEALSMIGAMGRQIVTSVLCEAGVLAILGASLGSAACLWLGRRLVEEGIRVGGGMVMEFVVPTDTMLLTGVVVTVVGLLAALGPALSISAPRRSVQPEP